MQSSLPFMSKPCHIGENVVLSLRKRLRCVLSDHLNKLKWSQMWLITYWTQCKTAAAELESCHKCCFTSTGHGRKGLTGETTAISIKLQDFTPLPPTHYNNNNNNRSAARTVGWTRLTSDTTSGGGLKKGLHGKPPSQFGTFFFIFYTA